LKAVTSRVGLKMVDFTDPVTVGYGLISLGVIMLLLEASMPGFFIGVPATILIILGVAAFVVPPETFFTVWTPLIVVVVGIPSTWLTILLYRRMAPPDEEPTTMTASNLVGLEGTVTAPVTAAAPRGKVKVKHEVWSAMTDGGTIPLGARVRIVRVDGVILFVEPVSVS
jgi:membrane protein implicated in regulation of membrane protease activity